MPLIAWNKPPTPTPRAAWHHKYLTWRDRIVLGNRKLIYRAVRRWMPTASWADDLIGDCQIVLIQAVGRPTIPGWEFASAPMRLLA